MQTENKSSPSKLKTIAIAVLALAIVIIAFLFTITSYEGIPDRARFFLSKEYRYIVPMPVEGQDFAHPLPHGSDAVSFRFEDSVTWGELRDKNNPYHDWNLPDTPEWNRFVFYGKEMSLFQLLFFPPPSRWDDNGGWRY